MKSQASNADTVLIESVIVKLTMEGKSVNKKPGKAWTPFIIPRR